MILSVIGSVGLFLVAVWIVRGLYAMRAEYQRKPKGRY